MSKLQELFSLGIKFGYKSKINNLDGQASWKKVKSLLDTNNLCDWNITRIFANDKESSDIEEIYSYIHNDLELYGEDGDEDKYELSHENWERAHYVLQTIRIPRTSDCSIQKILQIGLNIGQYKASNKTTRYNKVIYDFVKSNNLNQISSYINLSSCNIPNELLDQSIDIMTKQIESLLETQAGGSLSIWHSKYLKYKQKYLSLKQIDSHSL